MNTFGNWFMMWCYHLLIVFGSRVHTMYMLWRWVQNSCWERLNYNITRVILWKIAAEDTPEPANGWKIVGCIEIRDLWNALRSHTLWLRRTTTGRQIPTRTTTIIFLTISGVMMRTLNVGSWNTTVLQLGKVICNVVTVLLHKSVMHWQKMPVMDSVLMTRWVVVLNFTIFIYSALYWHCVNSGGGAWKPVYGRLWLRMALWLQNQSLWVRAWAAAQVVRWYSATASAVCCLWHCLSAGMFCLRLFLLVFIDSSEMNFSVLRTVAASKALVALIRGLDAGWLFTCFCISLLSFVRKNNCLVV